MKNVWVLILSVLVLYGWGVEKPKDPETEIERKNKWSTGFSIGTASLEEERYSGTVESGDVFDDTTTIFELFTEYQASPHFSPRMGFNTLKIKGTSFNDGITTVILDDIETKAFYIGLKAHTERDNNFRVYALLDFGISDNSDIEHNFSDSVGSGVEKAYTGGIDFFWAFGLGIQVQIPDTKLEIGLQWKRLDYGLLKGSRKNPLTIILTEDLNIITNNFALTVQYRF